MVVKFLSYGILYTSICDCLINFPCVNKSFLKSTLYSTVIKHYFGQMYLIWTVFYINNKSGMALATSCITSAPLKKINKYLSKAYLI